MADNKTVQELDAASSAATSDLVVVHKVGVGTVKMTIANLKTIFSLITTFLGLTDTPSSFSGAGSKFVKVNSGATALEFVSAAATTFLGLTDSPANYSGAGDKLVAVNTGATALEFISPAAGASYRGAVVKLTADLTGQNLTGGLIVPFDAEVHDTDTIHDTSTNNSRLTVPAGVTRVKIKAQAALLLATSGVFFQAELKKDGSSVSPGVISRIEITHTDHIVNLFSYVLDVTATEYFELSLFTEADTSVTIRVANTWFSMEIIE